MIKGKIALFVGSIMLSSILLGGCSTISTECNENVYDVINVTMDDYGNNSVNNSATE